MKRISALALVLIFSYYLLWHAPPDNVPEEPQENNQEQGATDTRSPMMPRQQHPSSMRRRQKSYQ